MSSYQGKANAFTITTDDGRIVEVPELYICPITLQPMVHPLMTREGRNFEREAIVAWLGKSQTCPLTRNPLYPRDLVPNRPLEAQMRFWRYNNGLVDVADGEEVHSADLPFVGFLCFHTQTKLHTQQESPQMSLASVAISSRPERNQERSTRSRPQEGAPKIPDHHRRRFLSRILMSATRELDEL
jgi:U-box domain